MKHHIWMWGIIGAVITAALGLFGMNVAPQANFSLGCLASLLIPPFIGYMAARTGAASNAAQGAIDGGLAAGIAAVFGGTVNVLMGCVGDPSQFTTGGSSALLTLVLSAVVVLTLIYFVQGCIVGVVAISLRGLARSR